MTGEQSPRTKEEDISALLGMTLFQAVAEGAVLMAKVAPNGSPEQLKWAGVVERAAEVAPLYRDEVIGEGSDVRTVSTQEAKPTLDVDERLNLQAQLTELEAKADDIRQKLGE